jgi:hypothetical protein
MMGGEAFILLKAGRFGLESTKQAEIRLDGLLKILRNRPVLGRTFRENGTGTCCGCGDRDFRWIWLICLKSCALLSRSQILLRTGAVCCMAMQARDQASIGFSIYTFDYFMFADIPLPKPESIPATLITKT